MDCGLGDVLHYGNIPQLQMTIYLRYNLIPILISLVVTMWYVDCPKPCGKFANASNVFVVHGRDIPADGMDS